MSEQGESNDEPVPASPDARRMRWTVTIVGGLVAVAVFLLIELRGVLTDTDIHIARALPMLLEGQWVGNFLYYVLVGVPSLALPNDTTVRWVSFVVLTVFVAWKARLVFDCIDSGESASRTRSRVVALAAVCACLAWSLPSPRLYLGQFPPNIWHNATLIVLFPFAIVAWWESARYLESADSRHLGALWWSVPLGVAAKPSFFLVFAPVFGLALLRRFGLTRRLVPGALLLATGTAVLAGEYALVYLRRAGNPYFEEKGARSIAIEPFFALAQHTDSLVVSIVASFLFPLAYLVLRGRRVLRDHLLRYSYALLGMALVIGILFVETGSGRIAGNFLWGIMVCNLIVFVACLRDLVQTWPARGTGTRERVTAFAIAATFALHVAAGLLYVLWGLGWKGRSIYV